MLMQLYQYIIIHTIQSMKGTAVVTYRWIDSFLLMGMCTFGICTKYRSFINLTWLVCVLLIDFFETTKEDKEQLTCNTTKDTTRLNYRTAGMFVATQNLSRFIPSSTVIFQKFRFNKIQMVECLLMYGATTIWSLVRFTFVTSWNTWKINVY